MGYCRRTRIAVILLRTVGGVINMSVTLTAVGIGCVGLVVGYFACYFMSRFRNYTLQGLTGVLGLIFAGVAVSYVTTYLIDDSNAGDMAWYPIGVAVGVAAWIVLKATGLPAALFGIPRP
jgi:hypothetical protein